MNRRSPYTPPLDVTSAHALWLIRQRNGRPMTKILRDAVRHYVQTFYPDIDMTPKPPTKPSYKVGR